MKWVKNQIVVIVTLAALLGGGLITWGRIQQICTGIDKKADKEAMTRELDQIHQQLSTINGKLDNLLLQQAAVKPHESNP